MLSVDAPAPTHANSPLALEERIDPAAPTALSASLRTPSILVSPFTSKRYSGSVLPIPTRELEESNTKLSAPPNFGPALYCI